MQLLQPAIQELVGGVTTQQIEVVVAETRETAKTTVLSVVNGTIEFAPGTTSPDVN